MRASTLGNNVLAINREIDSRYDAVIAVRDKLPEIELVAGMDLDALIAELENAQDFTGITVVSGTEVAWDAVNKVLTVPRGEQGVKGDKGDKGDIGLQGPQGPRGAQGPQGLKGDIGPSGPRGLNGPKGDSGKDGKDGKDLTVTQIVYNSDGTFTWMFSDGTNYVTPNLKGDQGAAGNKGDKGDQGISVHHLKATSTTDPEGDFGTFGELDTYTFYGDASETINLGHYVVRNGITPDMVEGLGMMRRATYDTNSNGIVDNAEKLNGLTAQEIQASITDLYGQPNGIATLDTNGKVVLTQIPDSVLGQLEYMGTWNLTTFPTATQKGQYWIASVSGNGYVVGDWAVWNGTAFDKVDNTDAVATVAGRTGNVVLTKSDVGLANVDNTADSAKPVSTAQQTALNLKANIASPTFTGVPAVPTAAVGTNTTQVASTAYVIAEINKIEEW